MKTLLHRVDQVIYGSAILLLFRGCCIEDHVATSEMSGGYYRFPDEDMSPLDGLTLIIDSEDESVVRFEYFDGDSEVIVDYDVVDRRFADEDE